MIKKHKLIIDKNCPMCQVYVNCFTRFGWVDADTIEFYQTIDEKVFNHVDAERAKTEVAFTNLETEETVYGIEAMMQIVAGENRLMKWFFKLSFVKCLGTKFYRIISYNRHVSSGVNPKQNTRSCIPSVNKTYRWTYILFAALLTGMLVNQFTFLLDGELGIQHLFWREYLVCFGQIAWQMALITWLKPDKRLAYLGNMSTVSLIGGLLLIPLLLSNYFFDFNWWQLLIGFAAVVGIMFFLHVRRCKSLGLPLLMSISWISYRTIVLIFVLLLIYFN